MNYLRVNIDRQKGKSSSIIAFNIQNIYHLNALKIVTESLMKPAIAQLSSKYVEVFEQLYGLENIVKKYQNHFLTFHLDHCSDFDVIKKCIDAGFDSVMFDGSHLPLKHNIDGVNKVYDYASSKGVMLEVELGSIGGVEDGVGVENMAYYDSSELVSFSEEAKYDILALAVGNSHGHYKSTSAIKIDLFKKAKDLIGPQSFVLHGGTGMPEEMIRQAIDAGVIKINVSTALKSATIVAMDKFVHSFNEYNESSFIKAINSELLSFYEDYINKYTA